jgi:uncharacterized protein YbaR (Trm112 family)
MTPWLQLEHLRCPATGGALEWMPANDLQSLREAVMAAMVVNRAGNLVTQPPDAVLVCRAAALAYPVYRGIPVLVPSEAIALGQVGSG